MTLTINKSEFKARRVAVLGMARTGFAAAPVLKDLGASVLLSDSADASLLGAKLSQARELGVDLLVGATPEAALEGAEIVIPSPGIRRDAPVLALARSRGLAILSEIELAYRICEASILAVTGTNGKTTTAIWLGDMLRESGIRTYVAGNVAADDVKLPLVTAAAQALPGNAIVAEISSFQLEWVDQFRPRVAVLTNITPDHLNRHASFGEYAAVKARMFARQTPDDVAVVNAVNAPARAIGRAANGRLFWFDRGHCMCDNTACVRNGRIVVKWCGAEMTLGRPDALKVPGSHNLENALAAAGAAIAFGADPNAVARSLANFKGVVHRMEFVCEIGGVSYYNNSMCTNVDAAVRSLEALGRPAVIIAGGADKNTEFAPLGAAIARKARHLVLMGSAADQIESVVRRAGFTAISRAVDMADAVNKASKVAVSGDAVMLSPACASFDMYADFEARGEAFRQAVHSL